MKPYRPPQSGPPIVKIASCESTFVALSELGDVFTFTSPTEGSGTAGRPKLTLKPQRVWALRKQMSAVVVSPQKSRLVHPSPNMFPIRMSLQVLTAHSYCALIPDTSLYGRGLPSLGIQICGGLNSHTNPQMLLPKPSNSSGFRSYSVQCGYARTVRGHTLPFA